MEEYQIRTIFELFRNSETAFPAFCTMILFLSIGYVAGLAFASGLVLPSTAL